MDDDQIADHLADHLGAAFHRLVSATHLTKQLIWASPAHRGELQPLLVLLGERSRALDEAQRRRGSRGAALASPSGLHRPNLLGRVGNDIDAAMALYRDHLGELATELQTRAAEVDGVPEAALLRDIAAELALSARG